MNRRGRWIWLATGLILGIAGTAYFGGGSRPVWAANDRHEDYIMATGPVTMGPRITTDAVWLLDYRAGKLLGTIVDRAFGKVHNWAEVDLVQQFNIAPKQNVHFLMTTGTEVAGQTPLYVTEVNTGRFGIYTMGPRRDGRPGLEIFRHDLTSFRP
jgi:hypothetical protein